MTGERQRQGESWAAYAERVRAAQAVEARPVAVGRRRKAHVRRWASDGERSTWGDADGRDFDNLGESPDR